MEKRNVTIEYVCTWCGEHKLLGKIYGRPAPGICPRKPKSRDGQSKPHTWVINRKF